MTMKEAEEHDVNEGDISEGDINEDDIIEGDINEDGITNTDNDNTNGNNTNNNTTNNNTDNIINTTTTTTSNINTNNTTNNNDTTNQHNNSDNDDDDEIDNESMNINRDEEAVLLQKDEHLQDINVRHFGELGRRCYNLLNVNGCHFVRWGCCGRGICSVCALYTAFTNTPIDLPTARRHRAQMQVDVAQLGQVWYDDLCPTGSLTYTEFMSQLGRAQCSDWHGVFLRCQSHS